MYKKILYALQLGDIYACLNKQLNFYFQPSLLFTISHHQMFANLGKCGLD